MSESVELSFVRTAEGRDDKIAILTLNRPSVANAFDPTMLRAMADVFKKVRAEQSTIRALLLRGAGKNFCTGADIQWMRDSAKAPPDENKKEASEMGELFFQLYSLPVPTVALAHGAVFGGGVGLIAACDWAIATEDAKFCFSEVKLGVVAAVILPYVMKKIATGQLRRCVLSARTFGAHEAFEFGLVQRIVRDAEVEDFLRDELRQICLGAPEAQARFKAVFHSLQGGTDAEFQKTRERMVETIATLRVGQSGQEGLAAFLEKRAAKWVVPLSDDWRLPEISE